MIDLKSEINMLGIKLVLRFIYHFPYGSSYFGFLHTIIYDKERCFISHNIVNATKYIYTRNMVVVGYRAVNPGRHDR